MTPLAGVRAVLFDLEGTLFESGRPVPGAAAALAELDRRGVSFRFVTNTTSRPRRVLAAELAGMGLPADPRRLFTAPDAGRELLLARGWTRAHLFVRPALREDFAGIAADDAAPDAVVLGDLGEETTYEGLNRAFRLLLSGARLVTLARNRYYRGPDGLRLDQGPFAAALEYASGREAILAGKPSPDFFAAALAPLGVPPSEAAVVGDDAESDVGGAQAAGMRGVLVRTGKFRESDLARSGAPPDAVIGSAADLPRLLEPPER
ncbi:MAG TPA: TIGR01458 family HAD-type hydrolase [Thermoanaerobaculia bacterium]|jgi:HAD superfamily hydrolase (TIGR01458 family)